MIVFYLLVWVLPLVQHPLWAEKIGPLSVFEYLGVLSLIVVLFRIFSRGKLPQLFSSWPTRFFFGLYLIATLSAFSERAGISLANDSFIIYTSSMFLFVLSVALVDTLPRLRSMILVVIGSYAWASLYMIREWQRGSAMGLGYRPGWVVGDSNYFATAAIFAMALAFTFMQGERPRWEKLYCSACLFITLVGVTLCASRGGFLGLTAASPLMVWRTQHRVRNLALIIALVLPLSLFLPSSPLHRFLHPSYSETGSEQAHQEAWKAGFRMMGTHPLGGIGLGMFRPMMPAYSDPGVTTISLAHNMFIEVAAELGFPALLLFLAIFVSSFLGLGRLRKSVTMPSLIRDAAGALQAGVFGFAVAGCFVSAEYQKTTWMGFALVACLFPLARANQEFSSGTLPANATAPSERRTSGSSAGRLEQRTMF